MKTLSIKFIAVILVCIMSIQPVFASQIQLDGRQISLNNAIYSIEGYNFVPLAEIFSLFDAKVSWRSDIRTATITNGDSEIKVTIGSNTAYVNGEPVTMPIAARIINDRTYVPISFASAAMGHSVIWQPETKTVVIDTTKGNEFPSINTAYETNYATDLTYEEAYAKALKNNNDIKTFNRTMDDLSKAREDTTAVFGGLMLVPLDNYTGYIWDENIKGMLRTIEAMTTPLNTKAYTQQILEGAVAASVKASFINIAVAQMKIGITKAQIELSSKALNNSALLLDAGMISKTDYEKEKLTHEQLVDAGAINERALITEYEGLNKLMGEKTDARYNVICEHGEIGFDKDFDLDSYIFEMKGIDPNLKIAKEKITTAENELKLFSPNMGKTYDQAVTAVASAEMTYADAMSNFEKTLRNAYTNLKNIETQIKSALLDIEKAQNSEAAAKVSLRAGNITELQYLQAVMAVEAAKSTLEGLYEQYEISRFMFERPFLLG